MSSLSRIAVDTWRNLSIYGIPFVPVIIAIYYAYERGEGHRLEDLVKSRKP